MRPLVDHHKADTHVQKTSQCVFTLRHERGNIEYFLDIDYDIAVEQYLHEKRPLSILVEYRGTDIEGTYNNDVVFSIRKLLPKEQANKEQN